MLMLQKRAIAAGTDIQLFNRSVMKLLRFQRSKR